MVTATKSSRKLSSFGPGIEYRKVRDFLHVPYRCLGYEFRDSQFGEQYNMLVADGDTGEVHRFTGRHARIMDRLHFGNKGKELTVPFEFEFADVGKSGKAIYDMVDPGDEEDEDDEVDEDEEEQDDQEDDETK